MKVQLSHYLLHCALIERAIYHLGEGLIPSWVFHPADVIDWMLKNLIEKSRTRRGVMKKLKDMGLQFSKPARKREKQNPNWSEELDEELRQLYAQYGEGESPMLNIMRELSDASKSQRMIVARLSYLGCITGKEQVLPAKKKGAARKKKGQEAEQDDDEDEFEFAQREDGTSFLKKKVKPKKTPTAQAAAKKNKSKPIRKAAKKSFNVETVQELIKQLTEQGMTDALEWLREAYEDVAEDLQDEDVDQEDAIPLVPIMADQREAVENESFKTLLREFGMQEPLEEMVSGGFFILSLEGEEMVKGEIQGSLRMGNYYFNIKIT